MLQHLPIYAPGITCVKAQIRVPSPSSELSTKAVGWMERSAWASTQTLVMFTGSSIMGGDRSYLQRNAQEPDLRLTPDSGRGQTFAPLTGSRNRKAFRSSASSSLVRKWL